MQVSSSTRNKITELQKSYIASMSDKHAEITTCWLLAEQQHWQGETVEKLLSVIHRLANSAASYGFPDISAAAYEVEHFLNQQSSQPSGLLDLHRSLQSLCSLLTVHSHEDPSEHSRYSLTRIVWSSPPVNKQILLLTTDEIQTEELVKFLENCGYRIHTYAKFSALRLHATYERPSVILLDISSTEDMPQPPKIRQTLETLFPTVPCIFISAYDSFSARLRAVRDGALAYLVKPISTPHLLEWLDEILFLHPQEPYKILLVIDDRDTANLYRLALEQVGMQVLAIHTPQDLIAALVEFKPEVILIDTCSPDYSNLDLALFVRQEEAYLPIPIIFLMTEPTSDWTILGSHCDKHLIKPISLEYLVQVVKSQVHYARKFNKTTTYDGLTGVLNQRTFMERMTTNIAMSERSGSPLALAIISINNLREINHQYGYWAGNRTLKQIAKIFKRRLRKGDLLGRYEGHQFIVALNDVDLLSAQEVFATVIREAIKIPIMIGEIKFYPVLNVGIAHYPGHISSSKETNHDIIVFSEQALRNAKQYGDNQVVAISLGDVVFQ